MQSVELNAEIRSEFGKSAAKKIRRDGKVPANYYIHGEKNLSLILDIAEVQKVLSAKHGVLELKIGRKKKKCIVRDIQVEPVTGGLLHLDLMGVKLTEKMVANVSVNLVGTPSKVRDAGGRIMQEVHELSVECLAKNLPDSIEIDISDLEPESSILVKDLDVADVTILTEGSLAVVMSKAPSVTSSEEVATEEPDTEESEEEASA